MLELYHHPGSRSSRFMWLLEELGVSYELAFVDIPRWSGKGGSPLSLRARMVCRNGHRKFDYVAMLTDFREALPRFQS